MRDAEGCDDDVTGSRSFCVTVSTLFDDDDAAWSLGEAVVYDGIAQHSASAGCIAAQVHSSLQPRRGPSPRTDTQARHGPARR